MCLQKEITDKGKRLSWNPQSHRRKENKPPSSFSLKTCGDGVTTLKCLALVGWCLVRKWVHTEGTRSPETRASLVSASGCCCLSGYPLPCSAVPDSSCFPARSDNQSHEMIMAWCGVPAHSSWDHSPLTPLQTRAESLQGRVLVQQSGRVLKFTSQWVKTLSLNWGGTNSWSSGGCHRGPQCHCFCPSHILLPPMPALSALPCGNHIFLCVPAKCLTLCWWLNL